MKLKEIKPGMIIRWESKHEKVALLEELERIGYEWYGTKRKLTESCDDKDIGHIIHVYNDNGYKNITHSNHLEEATHNFSDLIIPELTAEEVVEWLCKHYCDREFNKVFGGDFTMDELYDVMTPDEVVRRITQWKSDHEKKEPKIEWLWKSYVVGGSVYKEADTKHEAMEWCEYYVKEHPDAKCTYKHVCRAKAVE